MAAGVYAAKHLLTDEALTSLTRRGDALRKRLADIFEATGAPFKVSTAYITDDFDICTDTQSGKIVAGQVTGLGSINQLHCTLTGAEGAAGLKVLYFQLLEKGYWIAQRGLLALSFENTDKEIEGFLEAVKTSIEQA
jgi:glutamate-1-semialdehyde 2,1-aminomutase